MAHQALEALNWKANQANRNNSGGNYASNLDPWTAALLAGKGQGKGDRNDRKDSGDQEITRLNFMVASCGDTRRDRGTKWNVDKNAEVVCVTTQLKGLHQLLQKDRIVPIWLPSGVNYRKSLKSGRALQRCMSLAISERQTDHLIEMLEQFFADIGDVPILQDLLEEEPVPIVVPDRVAAPANHDSEDEWRHRRERAHDHAQQQRRRRWNGRRQARQDQDDPLRANDPWRQNHGPIRADVGEGDGRAADPRRHERFAMDTGDEGIQAPRVDDDFSSLGSARSADGRDEDAQQDRGARVQRRGGVARRPFGRARSASPRMGRTRSRERGAAVETPVLPAPKRRARREAGSPRRLDAAYPPLGHGR